MRNDDPALWDLSEVADAIAERRISSVEATEACLARIEAWQPRVNAFLRLYKDKALAQARRWMPSSPPASGAGRCTACRWRTRTCTTQGRALDRRQRDPQGLDRAGDGDGAGEARRGGRGRARLPQHGGVRGRPDRPQCPSRPLPQPVGPERVTGGSSSGSGASVAARLVYGALGSDTGGSIRLPAAACGVVGMKATYGRVSRAGAVARSWSLDHVGPLTRTVRDNARMLAVLAGHDPDDSTTSEKPVPDYEALLDGGVSGLRIGLALPNEGWSRSMPESARRCRPPPTRLAARREIAR
jgi:aspartyl-tRNA(Asn)/glutamyl-tRNA(Gln) amidotransferase subunit A